jgi:hypothetical protein
MIAAALWFHQVPLHPVIFEALRLLNEIQALVCTHYKRESTETEEQVTSYSSLHLLAQLLQQFYTHLPTVQAKQRLQTTAELLGNTILQYSQHAEQVGHEKTCKHCACV